MPISYRIFFWYPEKPLASHIPARGHCSCQFWHERNSVLSVGHVLLLLIVSSRWIASNFSCHPLSQINYSIPWFFWKTFWNHALDTRDSEINVFAQFVLSIHNISQDLNVQFADIQASSTGNRTSGWDCQEYALDVLDRLEEFIVDTVSWRWCLSRHKYRDCRCGNPNRSRAQDAVDTDLTLINQCKATVSKRNQSLLFHSWCRI